MKAASDNADAIDESVEAPPESRPQKRGARRTNREVNLGDRIFRALSTAFASVVVIALVAIAVQVAIIAWPSITKFGFGFLWSTAWDPVKDEYGALPFLFGTLVSSLLALLIAVPISIGIAVFLTELAPPWMRTPVAFLVELLAAVPSVVYGLWGVFVLAPWLRESVEPFLGKWFGFLPIFKGAPLGIGMLASGLILTIMILPTVSSITREVLRATPITLREGALALGATRWEVVRTVILPFAKSGIVGAVILGLGRALGETMAVTMVIGNSPQISASLFAPGYTMASVIANEFTEATGKVYLGALAEVGLLLFFVTFVLNMIARLMVRRVQMR